MGAVNNWAVSWQSSIDYPLYVYEAGQLIKYTVEEVGYVIDGIEYTGLPAGYQNGYSKSDANEYELFITNTMATEKIDISVTKVWDDENDNDGMRPESVSLTLLKNGHPIGEKLLLNDANNWSVAVNDLYRYSGGVIADYSLEEDAVDKYTVSYEETTDAVSGDIAFTVTNTHVPETKLFTVSKLWVDADDVEAVRPNSVELQLYKDGLAFGGPIILDASNAWQKQIELPLYENGAALVWTVSELHVPRYYTVSYDQQNLTVTNTVQSKLIPKTGDYNSFLPWLAMFGACMSGAVGLLVSDKKKNQKKR